ncbi:hypothetical protein K1719_014505 [Acacia pycnantha]|nr:hypothetical protein K1719_014505 [Acacia pycnantha]
MVDIETSPPQTHQQPYFPTIAGPVLIGVVVVGSMFISSESSWWAVVPTVAGALSTAINGFEHGGGSLTGAGVGVVPVVVVGDGAGGDEVADGGQDGGEAAEGGGHGAKVEEEAKGEGAGEGECRREKVVWWGKRDGRGECGGN